MSDRKDGQQNSNGGFSLDDILNEFSSRRRGRAAAPPDADAGGKVVPFPGARRMPEEPEEPEGPEEDGEELPGEEESGADDKVVPFPEKKGGANPLSDLLRTLSQKADDYADHMFEEEERLSSDETRRMERLIPGVDREESPRRERRPRREDAPAPDLSPQELSRQYAKGLGSLHVRGWLVVLLFLPALYLVLEPMLPLPPIPNPYAPDRALLTLPVKIWLSAGFLLTAMALSADVLAQSLVRLARLRLGMDTLLFLSCAATLGDALTMQRLLPRAQLPCCAVNILALAVAMRGEYHRRLGLRLACRTAAAASEPYLVTLDEEKWNGRDAYAKWSGEPGGFGSRIQADDGAQRVFRIVCPLLLLACATMSLQSSVGRGEGNRLWWCLSSTLTAACALSAPILFARPFHRLSRRLSASGSALAGWPGAAEARQGSSILLTDLDLFPPGSVSVSGIKVFGSWPAERVVGYTATLIHASGCGLDQMFHALLRSQGAVYRKAEEFACYEGGGMSAVIRSDRVLVGSAAFMNLMEVALPPGLSVKNAVFCAINGELAGIFALNYTLPDLVYPSVSALLQERISPVLATRDFNLIPSMLQQRFRLPADRMDYPPVERRRELSDPDQFHSGRLAAVLCREGLYPFAEAVAGARRLGKAVRLGAWLACAGAAIGVLLACYLTSAGAFASLSPFNLLIYTVLWLVPSWFITGWVDQY